MMGSEKPKMEIKLRTILGDDAFIVLVEKAGGTRFYVARSPEKSHDNYGIGMDILKILSEHFGGKEIKIPIARQMRAIRMLEEGKSHKKIALALHVTESAVLRLLKQDKPDVKAG